MGPNEAIGGRHIVVTGAAGGIGRAVCEALSAMGARVGGIDIAPSDGDGRHAVADIADYAALSRAMAGFGAIDAIVHAAGVASASPVLEGDPGEWSRMMRVNAVGTLNVVRAGAEAMRPTGGGHIVVIGSALARAPIAGGVVYAASKRAVSAIVVGARQELHGDGIRVSEVRAGKVSGTGLASADAGSAFNRRDYEPIGPEDVAAAVVHVLSTPAHLGVDLVEMLPRGQF